MSASNNANAAQNNKPHESETRGTRRTATSGMLEILILVGVAVATVALLAAWFSGWGAGETGSGFTLFSSARCMMHITLFEDIDGAMSGGGNKTFLSVDVANTGTRTIHTLQIIASGDRVINATTDMGPGIIFEGYETVTDSVDARAIEASATYTDGDVILCDKQWSTGAQG